MLHNLNNSNTPAQAGNIEKYFTRPRAIYKSRQLAKEARYDFITYFEEHYSRVRGLKFKVSPYHRQVVARAKYQRRILYARAWSVQDCFYRFVSEYEQKVLNTGH